MNRNTETVGAEKLTDAELSQKLGSYQKEESIGILLGADRKSTRLNSSHYRSSRIPSSA